MAANQNTFQQAMSKGHSAAWDQQWEKAAEHYRKALAEEPESPTALTSLGLALFELKQYDEALRTYQRAARFAPTDPIPLEKMARIFELQKRPGQAVQAGLQAAELQLKAQEVHKAVDNWLAVLRVQPENLLARTRLGMIFDRMGRKPEAVAEYLAAASIVQGSGDLTKALQLAEYALKVAPASDEARRALTMLKSGQALPRPQPPKPGVGLSRPGAGTLPAEKPVSLPVQSEPAGLDPVNEARQDALARLAEILFDQVEAPRIPAQQVRRGLTALARGLPGAPGSQSDQTRVLLHLSQAIESIRVGQETQAAAELERALEAGLVLPDACFLLGLLLTGRDRAKALKHLTQAVKHPAYTLATQLLIGQNYEAQEAYPDAAWAFLQALKAGDLNTLPEADRRQMEERYETLADGLRERANEEEQKSVCEAIRGLLLRPGWRASLQAARQQMSETGGLVPLGEMLLASRGGQVVDSLSTVRALTGRGLHRSAMEEAFFALQDAPTYLPLHVQMAELLLREGRVQDGVSKFMLLANLYQARGEAVQAILLLERVTRLAPMEVGVRTTLIDLLVSQGRIEEALRQSIELADFYYQIADLENARLAYAAALRLPAGKTNRAVSAQIIRKMADIDLQRLDLRQALRSFEQLRALQPDDAAARASLVDVQYRLGQEDAALLEVDTFTTHLERQGQGEKSMAFLESLAKDQPGRYALRRRLAEGYARAGMIEQAVAALDQLADELLEKHDRKGALEALEKIVALNPPNAAEYRAAIAQLR